jgi:tetratricopeptide (TPR) repeat protein
MTASSRSGAGAGEPPRVSELQRILPRVPELLPFLDLMVQRSVPDPDRRWAGSGELGTVGERVVDTDGLLEVVSELGTAEAERLIALLTNAARIVEFAGQEDWETVVQLLGDQGSVEERGGRLAAAESWYVSAHRLARDMGSAEAPRLLRLAARMARSRGASGLAAERYEDAWRAARDLDLGDDVIVAAIGRGNVDIDCGRWAEARSWYERALERIGRVGDPRAERWQVLQNLAIVSREAGELQRARQLLEDARAEGDRLGDPAAAVEVENGFGQLSLAAGDPRGAELHFAAGFQAADSPVARVTIGVNLGEALVEQGRLLEAGECAREAEADAIAASVTAKLPEVYRLLARVSRERAEEEAFVFLEQALRIIRENDLPDYEEALTREAYGNLRVSEGNPEQGLPQLRRAGELYRAIGMEAAAERVLGQLPGQGGEA